MKVWIWADWVEYAFKVFPIIGEMTKSDWAAWVQAVGSVGAILVAIAIAITQNASNLAIAERQHRAVISAQKAADDRRAKDDAIAERWRALSVVQEVSAYRYTLAAHLELNDPDDPLADLERTVTDQRLFTALPKLKLFAEQSASFGPATEALQALLAAHDDMLADFKFVFSRRDMIEFIGGEETHADNLLTLGYMRATVDAAKAAGRTLREMLE